MHVRGTVFDGRQEPPLSGPIWRRARSALKLLQVRLRLPLVLVFAAFVVGRWDVIRNHWDRITRRPLTENSAMRAVSSDTEYFCPMDPGVVSDWPGKCGICNMALVRRKRGEALALPDGVVARMQLSPYRLQLAGIQTTPVKFRPLMLEVQSAGLVTSQREAFSVQVDVPASQSSWVSEGQVAEVVCPDLAGQDPLAGHVRQVVRSSEGGWDCLRVTVVVDQPPRSMVVGMMAIVRIKTPMAAVEPFRSFRLISFNPPGQVLAVPRSAVVDAGASKVVFVERMPGMFDGVEVVVGPRSGGYFPVVRGLEPGEKVASSGAFLLDAETRLNPSLATAYFGAARSQRGSASADATRALEPAVRKSAAAGVAESLDGLSAADRVLATRQRICPVTGKPLGSMGTPSRLVVSGRPVFLCCEGCEERFQR
ncbi:MAG: heavy metal-binding domain-containing protein, partial [Isosphaeraceae bacterium]